MNPPALPSRATRPLLGLAAMLAATSVLLALAGHARAGAPDPAHPGFVGAAVCRTCHEPAYSAWNGSHHQLAMQPARPETVLGDFSGATFRYRDVETRFERRGDTFHVRTDGPDGRPTEYVVTHVFGVYPLQQLLIPFPGGRLQALSVAWDARPRSEGGQRWFHIYQDETVSHGDQLHWTGVYQN